MFKDPTKYTYYPTTHPFVIVEMRANEPVPDRYEFHIRDGLQTIVDKVLKKRPTWRCKVVDEYGAKENTNCKTYDAIHFFEGDENLGRVWYTYSWSRSQGEYNFNNARLEKARQRRGSNYSTKPEVVAKRVVESFYPLDIGEKLNVAADAAQVVISAYHANHYRNYDRSRDRVMGYVRDHIVRLWPRLQELIDDPTIVAMDIPALSAANQEASCVSDKCTVVVTRPGQYLLRVPTAEGRKDISMATLPDEVASKVGMLKLLEDKDVVPGVGARCSSDTFAVFV